RVLDRQGREIEAPQRRADRLHVHAEGLALAEPLRPSYREGAFVHVALGAVGRARQQEKHACGKPGLEIRPVAGSPVPLEGDAARKGLGLAGAEASQLLDEKRLQAPRTGSKEGLRAQVRFSMMNRNCRGRE